MQVPLRLAHRDSPPAADAFLLPADGFGPLAGAPQARRRACPTCTPCAAGSCSSRGRSRRARHRAVRLRRVSGDLFTPADATLLPALLPDEITALTRDRGLVVLPGGGVLAFDPDRPLPVSQWLVAARVRRSEWQPFPPRPDRPDRLTTIERPAPPVIAAIEVLTGKRTRTARTRSPARAKEKPGRGRAGSRGGTSGSSTWAGNGAGVKLGFGQFLAWLGRAISAPGLAEEGRRPGPVWRWSRCRGCPRRCSGRQERRCGRCCGSWPPATLRRPCGTPRSRCPTPTPRPPRSGPTPGSAPATRGTRCAT